MRELAERLYLDPSNLTALVDRLEALGLVERQADPDDRRVKRLVITDKGTRLSDEIIGAVFEDSPVFDVLVRGRAAPAPRSAQPSGRSTRPVGEPSVGGRLREEDARRLAVTMRCDSVLEAGARNRATPVSALHVERGRPSRTPVFEVEGHELGRAEQLVVAEAAVAGVSFWCRDDESVFAVVVADDAAEYGAIAGPLASWAHDEHDVNAVGVRHHRPPLEHVARFSGRPFGNLAGARPHRVRHRQGRGWRYPPALVAASSSSSRSGCCVTFVQVAKTSRYPWRPGTLHFS